MGKKYVASLCAVVLMGNIFTAQAAVAGMATQKSVQQASVTVVQGESIPTRVEVGNVAKNHAYIPQGTSFQLELVDPISSKKSKEGQTFRLKMIENIMINGVVVIPKDQEVTGRITKSRKNGLFGRKGRLEFSIPSVKTVNGIEVPLGASVAGVGHSDGGAVAVAALVTVVGGLFMKGTNVYYEPGQIFEVSVAKDTDLGVVWDDLEEEMNPAKAHGKNIQIQIR